MCAEAGLYVRYGVSSPSNGPLVISAASSEDTTVPVHVATVSPGNSQARPAVA